MTDMNSFINFTGQDRWVLSSRPAASFVETPTWLPGKAGPGSQSAPNRLVAQWVHEHARSRA